MLRFLLWVYALHTIGKTKKTVKQAKQGNPKAQLKLWCFLFSALLLVGFNPKFQDWVEEQWSPKTRIRMNKPTEIHTPDYSNVCPDLRRAGIKCDDKTFLR